MRKGILFLAALFISCGILLGNGPGDKGASKKEENNKNLENQKNKGEANLKEKIEKLIRLLGHENFQVREKATEELKKIGKPAVPYLEKALKSKEPEVQWRARNILQHIEGLGTKKEKSQERPRTQERPPVPDPNQVFPRFRFRFGGVLPKELEKLWKDLGFRPDLLKRMFPQFKEFERMNREFEEMRKRFEKIFKGFEIDPFKVKPLIPGRGQGTFKIYRWLNGKKIEETWRFRNGKWEKVKKSESTTPSIPPKTLPKGPVPKLGYKLGVQVEPAPKLLRYQLGLGQKGVIIRHVLPHSRAAKAGLVKWDIILEINGKSVSTPDEVRKILEQEGQKGLKIQVFRQGKKILIEIPA
ncbi:MAG: PDZ domain-containing protein, partial [Planctomycetota bacterium]